MSLLSEHKLLNDIIILLEVQYRWVGWFSHVKTSTFLLMRIWSVKIFISSRLNGTMYEGPYFLEGVLISQAKSTGEFF